MTPRAFIAKRFTFAASHQLTHLSPPHPCARLHGHNYEVEVVLWGPVDAATGFVRDYRALDAVKHHLDTVYDHRHLNDLVDDPRQTTAEHLAVRLAGEVRGLLGDDAPLLYAVRVSETPKTWAEVQVHEALPPTRRPEDDDA